MAELDLTGALPPPDRADRVAAVRDAVGGATVIVSAPADVAWITGFSGSVSWVVITPAAAVLVTDGRYAERAVADLAAGGAELDVRPGATRQAVRDLVVAAARGSDRVLADDTHLTHAAWVELAADLDLTSLGASLVPLRRFKAPWELARIARAAAIADAALAEVAPTIAPGMTEADVRDELEHRMRGGGADGPSYDTIVASGPEHAARPHHATGRRAIAAGDWLIIDVGALVDGYHSDLTRSYVVGEPTADQFELYDLVAAGQRAALDVIGPGVPAATIEAASRDLFAAAGRADWVLHGSGHGVGLLIHEAPWVVPGSADVLAVGDVVTCEPGLYRCGVGGVRIEDLVTVTNDGHRNLSASPKETPWLPSPRTT